MTIHPARVAWYVTGRFYENAAGELQDVGYFLHLSGIGAKASLFTGAMSESTAILTFSSVPFSAQKITNGNITIGLDAVGDFSLFLNPAGGATFDDPGSFAKGQRIGVFRRASVVMGETVASPLQGGLAIGMNVFSADLVESTPFQLPGSDAVHDLRELMPHGVTQWGTASDNPLPVFAPYRQIVAFTGSAIAAG